MSQDMELLLPVSGRGSLAAFVLMCNERMMNNYRQITQNTKGGAAEICTYTQHLYREKQADLHIHTEAHAKFIRHK